MADDAPLRAQHISNTSAINGGQNFSGIAYGNVSFGNSGDSSHGSNRKCEPFDNIPFHPDPDFVDRPETLAWIHRMCAGPGARAALVGLGGVGYVNVRFPNICTVLMKRRKSQLAIRYAYNIRDTTPHRFVFWVHASTKQRFEDAYEALADRLKLPGRHDPKTDILGLVSAWLCDETNGQWTMIVDNADDVEIFFPSQVRKQGEPIEGASASLAMYLPQSCNGTILFTSRNKDAAATLAGGYKNIREVFVMDKSQGMQLLRNKLLPDKLQGTSSEDDAMDLLYSLDYMPLTITQAAAYINRRYRMTITAYLSEFRANDKKKESLLNQDTGDLRRDPSASNSVVTTWQMSFERIRQERPSAAELLSLMSFFNPQGIPEWILKEFRRTAEGPGCEEKADAMFNEDLDTLQAYSLIAATAEPDTCEMHALVHFCTQVWLSSSGGSEQWKREFVELMAREFPNGEFENWSRCQQLLPHAEWLLNAELAADELLEASTWVLRMVVWYMWKRGDYNMAEITARKIVAARESVAGLYHLETLSGLGILASVLQDQGKYGEAEELCRRALEGREKELGLRHRQTLVSVNNLATVLQNQGKYGEAEELCWRALEGREKELGVRHQETLISVNNLATLLRKQGQYNEAEKLYRRALKGSEEEVGVRHPYTLIIVNNLATVLRRKQGQYNEAEKLYRRALKGSEGELGVRDPHTLASVNGLAYVLRNQGQYGEAKELFQRAYDGFVQEFGHQHPHTLTCLKKFLAMQQEEKQAGLEQSKE